MRFEKLLKTAEKLTYAEAYITVTGGREAVIENCMRVYECNEIMTRIRTTDGIVTIWGEGLITSSFREGTVRVSGKISSVELEEKAGLKDD